MMHPEDKDPKVFNWKVKNNEFMHLLAPLKRTISNFSGRSRSCEELGDRQYIVGNPKGKQHHSNHDNRHRFDRGHVWLSSSRNSADSYDCHVHPASKSAKAVYTLSSIGQKSVSGSVSKVTKKPVDKKPPWRYGPCNPYKSNRENILPGRKSSGGFRTSHVGCRCAPLRSSSNDHSVNGGAPLRFLRTKNSEKCYRKRSSSLSCRCETDDSVVHKNANWDQNVILLQQQQKRIQKLCRSPIVSFSGPNYTPSVSPVRVVLCPKLGSQRPCIHESSPKTLGQPSKGTQTEPDQPMREQMQTVVCGKEIEGDRFSTYSADFEPLSLSSGRKDYSPQELTVNERFLSEDGWNSPSSLTKLKEIDFPPPRITVGDETNPKTFEYPVQLSESPSLDIANSIIQEANVSEIKERNAVPAERLGQKVIRDLACARQTTKNRSAPPLLRTSSALCCPSEFSNPIAQCCLLSKSEFVFDKPFHKNYYSKLTDPSPENRTQLESKDELKVGWPSNDKHKSPRTENRGLPKVFYTHPATSIENAINTKGEHSRCAACSYKGSNSGLSSLGDSSITGEKPSVCCLCSHATNQAKNMDERRSYARVY